MLHLALMGMSPNRAGRQALPALVQQFHLDSPLVIVTAAFLLRVLLILVLRTFRLPHDFGFAFEIGSVARSVAEGDGFSSPFGAPTGPTAFAAPVYVYLLAGIFKIFGVYTNASALTALLLDSLFSGLTCWTIFLLARETFDHRIGIFAAWLWAFSPTAIHTSISYIWETCVSTFFLSLALFLTVRLVGCQRIGPWLRYGAVWAVTALVNGALLAVFPFLLLWLCFRPKQPVTQNFGRALVAGVACLICLSPWVIRNTVTFGTPLLRTGLVPEYYGKMQLEEELQDSQDRFPRLQHVKELKLYQDVGELTYVTMRRREAIQLITAHPLAYLKLCLIRSLLYWFGDPYRFGHADLKTVALSMALFGSIAAVGLLGLLLAFWRRVPYASLYAIPLLTFPVVYYITHAEARYRHPMEPYLMILTAFAIATVLGFSRTRVIEPVPVR